MALKVPVAAFLVIASVLGFQALRSRQREDDLLRRGRIAIAVEEAKAKNEREVKLRAPIALYATARDIDSALAQYTAVVARPVDSYPRVNPANNEIETWYKFEVVDYLSQPRVSSCQPCLRISVPTQVQPIGPAEIVVPRYSGSVVIDGVTVTSVEDSFPEFKLHQKYVLFLLIDLRTRVGLIDLAQGGVSVIQPTGEIEPLSSKSGMLTTELKRRFGNIEKIKAGLQYRRFPE
jgi:hypothetical protein